MKIRQKIALWVAGAGVLTSLVFSIVIFLEMREQPLEILDGQLKTTAQNIAAQLEKIQYPPEDGRVSLIFILTDRLWVKVFGKDGHEIYQSGLAGVVDIPLIPDKKDAVYTAFASVSKASPLRTDEKDGAAFRVLIIHKNISGKSCWIQIAKPIGKLQDEISDLLIAIAIGLAASSVLLIGVSYLLSGEIIKPIRAINRLSRDINENTLEKRIPTGNSRDEIYELSVCINQMFDRLQFSFSRQKQYLADASHELKTPIALLRLFFDEAVQQYDLPEDFRNQLQIQGRQVLRMDRLVKTLLELSVLEVKASLKPEVLFLSDMIRSVISDFLPLFEKEKIHIETDLPDALRLRGDPVLIRRLLINILDNAVKYNLENGRIVMSAERTNKGIRISLFNTGPGIPEEDIDHVFEQFYRVEKSHSIQYGGAGLGLAIVKKIADLHGGSVKMESEPGAWARIIVCFPHQQNQ